MARSLTQTTKKSTLLPDSVTEFLRRRLVELGGVAVIAIGVAIALALLTYHLTDPSLNSVTGRPAVNVLGWPGAYFADMAVQTLGLAAGLLALAPISWGGRLLLHRGLPWFGFNLLMIPITLMVASLAINLLPAPHWWPVNTGFGGIVGYILQSALVDPLAAAATGAVKLVLAPALLFLACGLAALTLGLSPLDWMKGFRYTWRALHLAGAGVGLAIAWLWSRRRGRPPENPFADLIDPDTEPARPAARRDRAARPPRVTEAPAPVKSGKRDETERQPALRLDGSRFELPPLNLLAKPAKGKSERISDEALEQNARMLEAVLDDFGVKGQIIQVRPGPVVTLYELEPAPGIKASRVIGLADDIARTMSAQAARIAVVPGRNAIGIELPNSRREDVSLRELLASAEYEAANARLPMALGKDIGGGPVIADLATMPHLLVAGTTGSGKSVAINVMILSLLYRLTPEQCRFIMVDPKMLELSVYDGIPHLLTPVVTDPKKAVTALKWAVREMEDRYRGMAKLGVRNIAAYNKRADEAREKGEILKRTVQVGHDPVTGQPQYEDQILDLTPLPLIVVIVDEMADLMLVAGKDIEVVVQRLAQMARAAGIHLIMATQRPSVDVITGTIKANLPTRISFQVTSKIDSRTILGEQGAEQLLGKGDMLYMAGGGRITRVHGPFVGDGEVEQVVTFLKKQGEPEYIEEVTSEAEDGFGEFGEDGGEGGSGDQLYDRAVAIVARDGKASTSYIQRQLLIGYNKAARIMERMEKEGVVSPANHAGKREILVGDHSR